MSTRDHFERPLRDGNGLLLPGCSVRLLEPDSVDPITDPIYVAKTGTDERTNPWITDNGVVDFYLQKSRLVRIGVIEAGGTDEFFFEDVEVGNVDLARENYAFTIAGPLSVQTGRVPMYIEADGEIERFRGSVGIASVGADIIIDCLLNGASIFGAGNELHIPAGAVTAYVDLATPVVVAADDHLTVDILQVGTTNTGSHLTAQTRIARY